MFSWCFAKEHLVPFSLDMMTIVMFHVPFYITLSHTFRTFHWWHTNRHPFTKATDCQDWPLESFKWYESSDRVFRTFSRGYYRCRECISIPKGVWEETVLVNVSSSIWHFECHWMPIPTACAYLFVCVEVLRLSQPNGSCRARSVYLTTRLLGRPSPLSG